MWENGKAPEERRKNRKQFFKSQKEARKVRECDLYQVVSQQTEAWTQFQILTVTLTIQ